MMRVLSIRADSETADIKSGRAILAEAIGHPSTVVMVIRNTGADVTRIADKAAVRSDPFPWREVLWVTDSRLFRDGQEDKLFAGHPTACGVALDFTGQPKAWVEPSAQLFDIEMAFLKAEG